MDRVGARSAIVVPIALPDRLEAIRRDHVDNARLGVPAHVTLLFPFVPSPSMAAEDVARAAAAVAPIEAFEVIFGEAKTFDANPTTEGVVWLAPSPGSPFIALTEAIVDAFPGYLPYDGLHDTVIPHLTLANVDVDLAALIASTRPELPFSRRVESAAVLVEDASGRWRIAHELPLG